MPCNSTTINSGIDLNYIEYEIRSKEHKIRNEPIRAVKAHLKAWQTPWMVRRIWERPLDQALESLCIWTHESRQAEVTKELVTNLNQGTEDRAVWHLNNLKRQPKYVMGTGKRQLNLLVVVSDIIMGNRISITALLDSGCMGSCVNWEFVKRNNLNTRKLIHSVPVYNADGSENIDG